MCDIVVLFCSVRCGAGPCGVGLPSFGRGAAADFRSSAGWMPSWGFCGWYLNIATAGFWFRLLGSLGEACCMVTYLTVSNDKMKMEC